MQLVSRGCAAELERQDDGAFAEYCRFKRSTVLKLPVGMSYEEGASFPVSIVSYPKFHLRNPAVKLFIAD